MATITYVQVQELIVQLPAAKLALAYSLLAELADKEMNLLSPQPDFILLSLKRSAGHSNGCNSVTQHSC